MLKNTILPRVALYKAFRQDQAFASEAYELTRKYMIEVVGKQKHASTAGMERFPGFYTIYSKVFLKIMKATDLQVSTQESGKDYYDITITDCLWHNACVEFDCPELCAAFCEVDDITYGELKKLGFSRTQTFGMGGICCDFHFYKKHSRQIGIQKDEFSGKMSLLKSVQYTKIRRLNMTSRKIVFEKIGNARDLGGLRTQDGHSIRPGLLLRSANLFEATDADKKKLEETYHLAKIIDLRTGMEKQEKPDVVPRTAAYLPIPIFDDRVIGISHEQANSGEQRSTQIPAMEQLYRMLITDEIRRKNLGRAAQVVMKHDFTEGSILWHCTEGKDRCGLLTVVLLGALGVDRLQIMEDYLLTNEVNEPKAQKYYLQMLAAGKSQAEAEAVKNAFLAKESYLNAAFAAIDEQYCDWKDFLNRGLTISEELIAAFREKVLQ